MPESIHCWPTVWLEAAAKAGFAIYTGGRWVFINDKLRDMLEEFGESITAAARHEERERCAKVCDGYASATEWPASANFKNAAAAIRAD